MSHRTVLNTKNRENILVLLTKGVRNLLYVYFFLTCSVGWGTTRGLSLAGNEQDSGPARPARERAGAHEIIPIQALLAMTPVERYKERLLQVHFIEKQLEVIDRLLGEGAPALDVQETLLKIRTLLVFEKDYLEFFRFEAPTEAESHALLKQEADNSADKLYLVFHKLREQFRRIRAALVGPLDPPEIASGEVSYWNDFVKDDSFLGPLDLLCFFHASRTTWTSLMQKIAEFAEYVLSSEHFRSARASDRDRFRMAVLFYRLRNLVAPSIPIDSDPLAVSPSGKVLLRPLLAKGAIEIAPSDLPFFGSALAPWTLWGKVKESLSFLQYAINATLFVQMGNGGDAPLMASRGCLGQSQCVYHALLGMVYSPNKIVGRDRIEVLVAAKRFALDSSVSSVDRLLFTLVLQRFYGFQFSGNSLSAIRSEAAIDIYERLISELLKLPPIESVRGDASSHCAQMMEKPEDSRGTQK